jgi:hypothetical protein
MNVASAAMLWIMDGFVLETKSPTRKPLVLKSLDMLYRT